MPRPGTGLAISRLVMEKQNMQTRTKVLSLTAIVLAAVAFGMILAGSLDFTRTVG